MSTFVTIIILLAAVLMIGSIFLQPSKGDGFVGGGATQTAMGSSGGTSFLFKTTLWCAFVIMAGSLYLSWKNVQESSKSALDTLPLTQVQEPSAPANSTSPVTQQSAEVEQGAPAAAGSAPVDAPQSLSAPETPKKK